MDELSIYLEKYSENQKSSTKINSIILIMKKGGKANSPIIFNNPILLHN